MIESHFGESPALTVGVEEELMILDASTLELSPSVQVLLDEAEGRAFPGTVKTERFASALELTTGTCSTPDEAVTRLGELRRAAGALAYRHGLQLAAAGSHPISRPDEQAIVPEPRYEKFVDYAGPSARRQGVSGLHLHVGMPSGDACLRALENLLPWLPLTLALSANSPYLAGEETGMLSARAEVLALLPRSGAPPAFHSYADWESFVERMVASGVAASTTAFWWDVRPHPAFGTLEIRVPDQPTELERTRELVHLLHTLAAWALDAEPREMDPAARGVYAQNRWAAARFGPRAELIHPDRFEAVSVPRLLDELLEWIGPVPGAGTWGEACEGDRQLEVGRASGLRAVCEDLVERSLA